MTQFMPLEAGRWSMMINSARRGFTIVELLIVMVVIAILAAITIVAYNGVTARAEKVKTISAVRAYLDALAIYKVHFNGYPTTGTYCLGDGYVDHTGDGVPDCRWNSGNVTPNAALNTALQGIAPSTAPITQHPVMSGTSGVVGLYFMNDSLGTLDGQVQQNWLVYAVTDHDCGMTVPTLSSTYPQFVSKSDSTASENWGNGGLCWVPLD